MIQNNALDILKAGANVFLTGEPGSGKTHTVNAYAAWLRERGIEPAITASTGIAATHIGGMTIHSWSGIGIRQSIGKRDLEAIMKNSRTARRVRDARVLVIDEISMLAAQTLEAVDTACRGVRKSPEPFGGLQIVLVGDFFQLPPVRRHDEGGASGAFAFNSGAWARANLVTCYLSEQHRQEDPIFLRALSAVRRGEMTDETHDCFSPRAGTGALPEGTTKLFPHNADVDRLNNEELGQLHGEAKAFHMTSRGAPNIIEALKRGCLSPETLALKTGAKVMFTKNSPEGRFANGTTGIVVGFSKTNGMPIVRTNGGRTLEVEQAEWMIQDNGKTLAKISQLPLRLAWAITVHKSQGMSLDSAVIDLSNAFEYGQGYVALSRVRTLLGLHLIGINGRALEVHPEVMAHDAVFRAAGDEARIRLSEMEPEALAKLHAEFVARCGGGEGAHHTSTKEPRESTYTQTKALLLEKLSLEDIAKKREITIGTVIGHLEKLAQEKEINIATDAAHLRPEQSRFEIMKHAFEEAFRITGSMPLAHARNIVGANFSFDELRLARLFIERSPE